MSDSIDVKAVPEVGWHLTFDKVLRSIGSSFGPKSEPDGHAMGMNVDRQDLSVKGVHQYALGHLLPDPRKAGEEAFRILIGHLLQRSERGAPKLPAQR